MALAIANAGLGKARKRTQANAIWASLREINAELATGSYSRVEGEPHSRPWANADRARVLTQRWPA
jgi:hypothetical protein